MALKDAHEGKPWYEWEPELAMREKKFAFLGADACALDATHAHMSFYNQTVSDTYDIGEVNGATLYEAIVNAYADLADDFATNASIVMKKADYYTMIKELTNNADVLFKDKPAKILGVPVSVKTSY